MKIVVAEKYQSMGDQLNALPHPTAEDAGEVVYQKRNEVRRVVVDGKPLMVKRYKRPNMLQRFVYTFFRPSKAERAYRFAAMFRERGIETPHEVAYMEERRSGLFADSWFVSEEATGTESHLLLREVQEFSHELADAVMAQVVMMHSKGILHGDLNLSNFLCTPTNEGYRFSMIDTNRSRFCQGWPSRRQCVKNLVRLTHRRDLFEYLVSSYARQRGWDEQQTVSEALRELHRFEHRIIK